MSGASGNDPYSPEVVLQNLHKWLKDSQEASERERQRIASLPKEQREALARQHAEEQHRRQFDQFRSGLGNCGKALHSRESWTLADFSDFLVGFQPGNTFDPFRSSKLERQRDEIRKTLESCAGTQLLPVVGSPADSKALYQTSDLLVVARSKGLGQHEFVAKLAGELANQTSQLAPASIEPPRATQRAKGPLPAAELSAAGREARRSDTRARRKAQLALAKSYVQEGKGSETQEGIALSVNAKAFNDRLGDLHPEYRAINSRTLQSDRAHCRPPIDLRRGRPPKAVS